ncbi:MAG: hypothetical protein GY711_24535, partial [bacterium]|nr:hypothetical protein [bacterium]
RVRRIERTCTHENSADLLREDLARWTELGSRAIRDQTAGRTRAAPDRRWRRTIADIVRDGQRSGEFADIDVDKFAMLLASLLDGILLQHMLEDPEAAYERARDICVRVACRYLEFPLPDEEKK